MESITKFINSLPTSTLLIIVVVLVILVIGLISGFIWQSTRIYRLQLALHPRYGFLGKTLPVVLVLVLGIGTLSLSYYLSNNTQTGVKINAEQRIDMNVVITPRAQNLDGTYPVSFKVIPSVDDVIWAVHTPGTTFDIFWNITGTTHFSKVEYALSNSNPGGFVYDLPEGSYSLNIGALYNSKLWQKTVEFKVP